MSSDRLPARRQRRVLLACLLVGFLTTTYLTTTGVSLGQVAGDNVNMVSGTGYPGGDPFLQRPIEMRS